MNLSQVQAHLAKKITSTAALVAFGNPFIFNPLKDTASTYNGTAIVDGTGDHDEALAARLRTSGVAIEIDWPAMASQQNEVGAVFSRIVCTLFVAELKNHTHSPTGLALVDATVAALKARNGSAWIVDVADYAFFQDEQGSALHVITTSISVRNS